MKYKTQNLRDAVFDYFTDKGTPLVRIGSGQRWVVELPNGEYANLKASIRGSMITSARGFDADAELIGMGDDVSRVLCAMLMLNSHKIELYDVPKIDVVNHYQKAHAIWVKAHPDTKGNDMRVCYFRPVKENLACAYVGEKWEKYHIDTIDLKRRGVATTEGLANAEIKVPAEVVANAKAEVAEAYGITVDQVTITVAL
ncbi:MAG: hypothetical protein HOL66_06955 [Rhodospirillaceae bacterium]|jgi:hypothetical protein|nr:hypothetical protein [Rhodospirillaceae bacterium]MBT5243965.1 hypothetical protein [Rhodospirillaceae bacterium]MBT5560946.1 hypothetical protein [Rhodospirillaceae bacterium]MBT6242477.1 hypothetical protein [Rhodospirillaceae bacterium]MBT7137814.1 hypothetical protein [Rhodospirillaceae bacterium]